MDAKANAEKAERNGIALPSEQAFDSNCITPGTPFMDRLHEQLKYYISKKISEDSLWKDVKVILSGHDVPGEGEHKIMEFIRSSKAMDGYNPNTRHCLYGLDADLMMLGLLSHEPHFSLLREEVLFGRKPQKHIKTATEQSFFLLHLSLLREYLGFEFEELRHVVPFTYDFERVLDDFILMAFFVGNDFLPHLPGLHIKEGGLAMLFEIYKEILPKCDGYLNDNGVLNVSRCQKFFQKLGELEMEEFRAFQGDSSWMNGKKASKPRGKEKGPLILSISEEAIFARIKTFVSTTRSADMLYFNWSRMPAGDRAFTLKLIESLGLGQNLESGDDVVMLEVFWDGEGNIEESSVREIALRRYEIADKVKVKTEMEEKKENENVLDEAVMKWKREYYKVCSCLTVG